MYMLSTKNVVRATNIIIIFKKAAKGVTGLDRSNNCSIACTFDWIVLYI